MKQDIAKIWVEALRSGKYKQGKEFLLANNKYCCLGVLCDLYLKHIGNEWEVEDKNDGNDVIVCSINGSDEILPKVVQAWAGIGSDRGVYQDLSNFKDKSLTEDNDKGQTFEEIAETIEQYIHKL